MNLLNRFQEMNINPQKLTPQKTTNGQKNRIYKRVCTSMVLCNVGKR